MAYIGQAPANKPLGASDITDGIITDAKIAGMSSSKLSGALPAISGASLTGISSTWVQIGSTTTASSTATVDYDNLASTYQLYVVIGTQIRPATNGAELEVNFGTDGSTYSANKTSVYGYQYNVEGDNEAEAGGLSNTPSLGNSSSDQPISHNQSNHGTYGNAGFMIAYFSGIGQGSNYGSFDIYSNNWSQTNRAWGARINGHIQASADCIRFNFTSGNIAQGKFTLFGVNQ